MKSWFKGCGSSPVVFLCIDPLKFKEPSSITVHSTEEKGNQQIMWTKFQFFSGVCLHSVVGNFGVVIDFIGWTMGCLIYMSQILNRNMGSHFNGQRCSETA